MGIEALNTAAHAAGFALVGTDDLAHQPDVQATPDETDAAERQPVLALPAPKGMTRLQSQARAQPTSWSIGWVFWKTA